MSEDIKKLQEKVDALTKAVSALLDVELRRIQQEQEAQRQIAQEEDKALRQEIYESLKQEHLGKLVIYAIKKDLIPRGKESEE